MLSVDRLLLHKVPLEAVPGDAAALPRLARALGSRRFEPLGHQQPLVLPSGEPDWLSAALTECEALAPGAGAALLEQLLLEPERVYEVEDGNPPDRTICTVCTVQWNGSDLVVYSKIAVPGDGRRSTGFGSIEISAISLADIDAVRASLVELAGELTDRSFGARSPDRVSDILIVGFLTDEEQNRFGRELWAREVRAAFLTKVERRPSQSQARVERFKGDQIIVLAQRCGQAYGPLAASADASRTSYVPGDDSDGISEEIAKAVEAATAPPTAPPTIAPTLPTSPSEVEKAILGLQGDTFCLTRRAKQQLHKWLPDYPDPSRILDALEALALLAESWVAANGDVGPFAQWAASEGGLSKTALTDKTLVQMKIDEFEFEGKTYSRQPHVQVDDAKAWIHCARIYFALDKDGSRFIVDHIGPHLY